MAFAYVCHHNSFLIYHSLKNTSERRFAVVTYVSVGLSTVVMSILGVTGYLAFGRETKGWESFYKRQPMF